MAALEMTRVGGDLIVAPDDVWMTGSRRTVTYSTEHHAAYRQLEEQSLWFRHHNRILGEACRQFPPGGTLVDVSGGYGFVARGAGLRCRGRRA